MPENLIPDCAEFSFGFKKRADSTQDGHPFRDEDDRSIQVKTISHSRRWRPPIGAKRRGRLHCYSALAETSRGGRLTLLFTARDPVHNNAIAVREYLLRAPKMAREEIGGGRNEPNMTGISNSSASRVPTCGSTQRVRMTPSTKPAPKTRTK